MKILFVSLGCDKNLVDSEKMLGMLQEKGYTFTDDEAEADVVVVNTCCFIGDAKEESVNTILDMARYKEFFCCFCDVSALSGHFYVCKLLQCHGCTLLLHSNVLSESFCT